MPKKPSKPVVLAAPDQVTAAHVAGQLNTRGLTPVVTFWGNRGWERKATEAIKRQSGVALLLVPAAKLGRQQLHVVDRVIACGGLALAWIKTDNDSSDGDYAERLIARLLEQRGALTDHRLPVLVETLRIATTRGFSPPRGLRLRSRNSALADYLGATLRRVGVNLTPKRRKGDVEIEIVDNGDIILTNGARRLLRLADAQAAAGALALLTRVRSDGSQLEVKPREPDRDVIDLIARPPARQLSETTSKRLMNAYGIESGTEHLCRSPTEAVRFLSELGSRIVLKLVKPELDGKDAKGAVVTSVDSAAQVRRAYHSLMSLASTIGPPKPLGVLVAEQIDDGARIWIQMTDHNHFGRLVIGGPGDEPTERPVLALTVPAQANMALDALIQAGIEGDLAELRSLALAMARFTRMVHDLGSLITSAAIHPLVARSGDKQALALDALVAIGS